MKIKLLAVLVTFCFTTLCSMTALAQDHTRNWDNGAVVSITEVHVKPGQFNAYINDLKISLNEPGRYEALKGLMSAPKTESEQRLGQITTPTLVVMGTKDPDWSDPKAEASYIEQAIPNAQLLFIEDAGHYPQAEMPEQTNPAILEFLNGVN